SLETKLLKYNAEVVVGGSVAKGTWIKGSHDLDFFVRFDIKHEKTMEKLLKRAVNSIFKKSEVLHGSRDYLKTRYRGYYIEIVPTLKIEDPSYAKNSMDASPFHSDYVKSKISKNPRLADEIRLLKAFSKAQKVYGAETHISGLSGYVIELLLIHSGSFLELAKIFDIKTPKIFLDIEKKYSSESEIKNEVSDSKLKSPIVLIDPVLKKRNAAAALNYDTYAQLVFSLRKFLRSPSKSFFKEDKMNLKNIRALSKKRGTLLVSQDLGLPKEKEDVFYAKLSNKLNRLNSMLASEGIDVYDYGFFKENSLVVYFELGTLQFSKMKKHFGPPVWVSPPHFEKFLKKWKNRAYVCRGKLCVDISRGFKDVKSFVSKALKEAVRDV
ncbi:MAG TPA: CCA tRNA nucleotidyltransferase, partial [Candidatus Woesearchaeota archaeon]|nr:CCA tRNA nucleotidyltransferase [Candidatus Woesearchaeota archaeon]